MVLGAKDRLFVSRPALADTALASLSSLGWGEGRFQAELRDEIVYQFQRKGVPTVDDSTAAVAWLAVRLDSYENGPEGVGYLGSGWLRKTHGERKLPIEKKKAKDPERKDPTVDNIRAIAEAVVSQARKPKAALRKESAVPVQMWMLF